MFDVINILYFRVLVIRVLRCRWKNIKVSANKKSSLYDCFWLKIPMFAIWKPLGEMQEWLNWHAWKACKPQKGFGGSNPSLSATEDKGVNESLRLFVFIVGTGLPGTRVKTKRDTAEPPLSECCRDAAGRQGKNAVNPRVGVINGFFVWRISFLRDPRRFTYLLTIILAIRSCIRPILWPNVFSIEGYSSLSFGDCVWFRRR